MAPQEIRAASHPKAMCFIRYDDDDDIADEVTDPGEVFVAVSLHHDVLISCLLRRSGYSISYLSPTAPPADWLTVESVSGR